MQFFDQQDVARRRTSRLVFYFVVAVLLTVGVVYLVVAGIFLGAKVQAEQDPNFHPTRELWNPELFLGVAVCTLGVIAVGSLYKIAQLGNSGAAVARSVGGTLVNTNTSNRQERMLLNVVEEMSLAAGMPVPPVYVLQREQAINAFAAGTSPSNAVVAVTRGCLEMLNRDELQGVIGHEFSHILNGDMRLNLRLIGVLHGLLLISIIGYWMFRLSANSRGSSDGKKSGAAFVVLGIALYVIGYVGMFFGSLIKSAVSRQREFLADASSVQFTRNPAGIAGALRKIGGYLSGSRIQHAGAQEASHLFFGNALSQGFLGLLATHPPLAERIKRIDPAFDGKFPTVRVPKAEAAIVQAESIPQIGEGMLAGFQGGEPMRTAPAAARATSPFRPGRAIDSIGEIDEAHLQYARNLVACLPAALVSAAREPLGALACVYALLLDRDEAVRQKQWSLIKERADAAILGELPKVVPLVDGIPLEARLPLAEMARPALATLSPRQYQSLKEIVRLLVEADQRLDLFEYALQRMLISHLAAQFEKVPPRQVRYAALGPVVSACRALLSTLAHVGQRDPTAALVAFDASAATLSDAGNKLSLLPREQCRLEGVDEALAMLAAASPQVKKRVLRACATCIGADGRTTLQEYELLRVIADSLDCPMPPRLATASE